MAKSIRAKANMASRARKRLSSHYAITDAARTQRLSDRLLGKDKENKEGMEVEAGDKVEDDEEKMDEEPKKISTSGSRGSRRESWRLSKGMPAKPKKSTKGCKNKRRR
ncbi:hypothetical protein IAU60_002355 [Kwoniella sp. DSM 27419]